jgi:hypothetical protein
VYTVRRAHLTLNHDSLLTYPYVAPHTANIHTPVTLGIRLRAKKKFGILQPASASRLDIGIKLKGQAPAGRFEAPSDWNAIVTNRVRIEDAKDIDAEVPSGIHNNGDATVGCITPINQNR